jgi:hypothetical protein
LECTYNQVDPQYETTQGLNYRLSVLLCQDGFSFLVIHVHSHQVLKLASYKLGHDDVKYNGLAGWPVNAYEYFSLIRKIDFLQLNYRQVDIAIASAKITTAPQDFFIQSDAMDLVSATYAVSPDDEILIEPIFDLGPATAILVPRYVKENCMSLFPGAYLRSAPAVFVKGVMRNHSQLISRQVFINIHREYFEITVIQGVRLLYLNAFRYSTPSDVLYYVIFVLEQLGFVPSEQDVTLMGNVAQSSTIAEELKMYCGSLHFAECPDALQYNDSFNDAAMHQYFTLLNISLCE